jgi:hypothetical protein
METIILYLLFDNMLCRSVPSWYGPCKRGCRGPGVQPAAYSSPHPMRFLTTRILVLSCCAALIGVVASQAEEVEAIESKTAKDYVRKKLPDGTFQPETYTFGKGDDWRGARVDSTIDHMDFMDVARILAVPLANKQYFPTADPKTTDELIMMYWGTTRAPEDATESNSHMLSQQANDKVARAQLMLKDATNRSERKVAQQALAAADDELLMANEGVQEENQRREDQDMKTATLLGYDSWWVSINGAMGGTALGYRKADMQKELEEDRYFVVLTAFDYQKLVKEKKQRFLWEVRFSIREHGTAFDDRIKGMAELASDYFGRNSAGLHHDEIPDGKVEIGPVKSLGVVPGK